MDMRPSKAATHARRIPRGHHRSRSAESSGSASQGARIDPRHMDESQDANFDPSSTYSTGQKRARSLRRGQPLPNAPQSYIPEEIDPSTKLQMLYGAVGPPHAEPQKADEWDTLAELLRDHDSIKVANCNGDIDSLLIFTGLFSAIVAAFTVESYKNLQPDPALHSTRLLEQLVLYFNGTEALQAAGSPIAFESEPSSTDVVVNIFWFLSLIFTLTTASLGVFVKQWLRYYLDWSCSSSVERIRVRHFRYEGLMRWRVFEIAAFLPLLLQAALLLFLLGLTVFLQPINITVGWVVTIAILVWIGALFFILISPFLSAHCPYHIAILWRAAGVFRGGMARIAHGKHWILRRGYRAPYYRFPGDEKGIRREPELGVDAVISADESLLDNFVLKNTLLPCARTFGMHGTVRFARNIVSHRLERKVNSLLDVDTNEYNLVPTAALDVLFEVICDRLTHVSELLHDPNADMVQRHEGLMELTACLYAAANSALASASQRYLRIASWPKVSVLLGSQPLRLLFLDQENLGIRLVTYNTARTFARILMNTPGVLIRANHSDSSKSIQALVRGAFALMEELDGPRAISLARGVFEYIENAPSDALRQAQDDLSKLVYAIRLAIQARQTIVERGSQPFIDIQRALNAAGKLNSRGTGELIHKDLIRLLRNYSSADVFIEPPQPEDSNEVPSSPPFNIPVAGHSEVPRRTGLGRQPDYPPYHTVVEMQPRP